MLIVELSWDNSTRLWPDSGRGLAFVISLKQNERRTKPTARGYSGWELTHGNATPMPAISATWRSQASKNSFFQENARSRAGNTVLSMVTQILNELVTVNLVKIVA